MSMYNPIEKNDSLVLGKGTSIVVTGWTPCETVVKRLRDLQTDFACVGNLYNAHYGITPIIINLLANPYPYPIHILAATRQDKVARSSEALYNLLHHNYVEDENEWRILSQTREVIGSLHKAIREEDILSIQNKTYLWDDMQKMCWEIANSNHLREQQITRRPKLYTISDTVTRSAPARYIGHTIECDTVEEAWVNLLHRIRHNGVDIDNRQELLDVMSIIHNQPADAKPPKWVPVSEEGLQKYYNDVLGIDNESAVTYTYGNRLRQVPKTTNLDLAPQQYLDQIEETAIKLALDPNSTRAVMTTWEPAKDIHSSQPPCLNSVFCRIQAGKLSLTVTFRSHDIFSAYYSNLCAVRQLQQVLVERINELNTSLSLEPGSLVCLSQSAHIYRWSFSSADALISEHYCHREKYSDPVGNFVISLVHSGNHSTAEIVHLSPQGQVVKVYRYTNISALNIVRDIAADNPSILATHLAYLGVELQKLEHCFLANSRYDQDRK